MNLLRLCSVESFLKKCRCIGLGIPRNLMETEPFVIAVFQWLSAASEDRISGEEMEDHFTQDGLIGRSMCIDHKNEYDSLRNHSQTRSNSADDYRCEAIKQLIHRISNVNTYNNGHKLYFFSSNFPIKAFESETERRTYRIYFSRICFKLEPFRRINDVTGEALVFNEIYLYMYKYSGIL